MAVNLEKPLKTSAHSSTKRHLVLAAAMMGLLTLASRVLGMMRDIVSAREFGTTWQWDAFIYAFMLPNFFRRLVGEGALSNAFIPIYSETLQKKGREEAFRFANIAATFLAVGLAVFLLGMEGILQILLKSGVLSPRLHLSADLLQYFFPYLACMSLFALGMGILNCHRHFFAPSLGSIILDIFWIAGVLWIPPAIATKSENELRWLAGVILASGLIQLAVEIPPLYRLGFRFRWIWDRLDAGIRKTIRLILPAVMSFAVVQINLLVDQTLAFWIGAGANSSLWYGNRLMQFPLGVFAIAMGTAVLPTVSNQAARADIEAAKKTLSFALRSVFLIILPCSVGLIVLRQPMIQLLFERGEFDAASTARTAAVLLCYSLGLFAFSGQKIIAAGFYALQDTRTPVRLGVVALVSNIVLNLIFMIPLAEAGLALATSLSGILQFVLLMIFFERKVSNFPIKEIRGSFVKTLLASLAMGGVCIVSLRTLEGVFPGTQLLPLLFRVFGSIGCSVLAYVLFCFLFRAGEMKEAWNWLFGRR